MSDFPWHRPQNYSQVLQVLESGMTINTTPHGLRAEPFHAPVAGVDWAHADILLYGHRDAFSTDVVDRIRKTQERRIAKYKADGSRSDYRPKDIRYVVAYKGQCMGYVTTAREVHMNETMRTAGPAVRRAYGVVSEGLAKLAARADSFHFETKGR